MFLRKGYRASTREFLDYDSKGRFYTAGTLAGSTATNKIFYEYLSFARLSKFLSYSESSGIPLGESPILLLSFSGYSCSWRNNRAIKENLPRVNGLFLA